MGFNNDYIVFCKLKLNIFYGEVYFIKIQMISKQKYCSKLVGLPFFFSLRHYSVVAPQFHYELELKLKNQVNKLLFEVKLQ